MIYYLWSNDPSNQEAGAGAGETSGAEAGLAEAVKQNVLALSPQEVEDLKLKLAECGAAAGKEVGTAAGTEAGSRIDIPHILQEAVAAATKAAEQVFKLAIQVSIQ